MESLKNLISLFDSEKFFFMTTFLPVMLYKDFSETQRISIFYIIFWSFPTYQKYTKNAQSIPVVYIIMLFIIILWYIDIEQTSFIIYQNIFATIDFLGIELNISLVFWGIRLNILINISFA